MGECINLRRGGKTKALPVLNPNFPADFSCMTNNGTHTFKIEFAEHGYPADYTYKWYWDGSLLDWATTASCTVSLAHGASTHTIYCEVTNKAGTVRSRTATITLTDTYLYSWGNEYTNVTGGWQMTRALNASSQPSYSLGNFSKSTSGMTMHLWSNTGHDGFVGTYNKIDLTHYSKIEFVINDSYSNCSDSYNHYFCATSINNNNGASTGIVAQTAIAVPIHESTQATRTYYVDVSGVNGAYYVGVLSWLWRAESRIRVCSVRLIP